MWQNEKQANKLEMMVVAETNMKNIFKLHSNADYSWSVIYIDHLFKL